MFPSSNIVINSSSATAINQQPVSYPLHNQPSFFIHRPNFHNDLISTPNPNPNSNSKQENPPPHHPPLYCFDFPSPFGNDDVLLPQQQHHDLDSLDHSQVPAGSLMREAAAAADGHQHQQNSTTTTTNSTVIKMVDWDSNKVNHDKNIGEIPMRSSSRRCCKRDRHSKIKTARGMRDRRMRLSLEIAPKFFWLQDALGFDKASKTVGWLLKQAEPEIQKLLKLLAAGTDHLEILNCYHTSKSTSSATSESCEGVSGIDEVATNLIDHKPSSSSVKETKRNNQRKRSAFNHPLAKASREKARARARERTIRENMRRRERSSSVVQVDGHDEDQSKQHQKQQPCDQLSRLSSWSTSPFEAGEESTNNNNNINHDQIPNSLDQAQPQLLQSEVLEEPISNSQLAAAGGTSSTAPTTHQDLHLLDDHNGHDSLVLMERNWSPSPIFNSLQQSSTTGISQEQHYHQFADFQFFGKPWEAYNTHNLF